MANSKFSSGKSSCPMCESTSAPSSMSVSANRVPDGSLACLLPSGVFARFPPSEDSSSDLTIFLVDASGSMGSIWPHVARAINTFSGTRPGIHVLKWANEGTVRREGLKEDLLECLAVDERRGEGIGLGTNITAALTLLRNFLYKLVQEHRLLSALVVFVSDGHGSMIGLDSVCEDIRQMMDATGVKIEMTTLGIGAGFPTHIAMSVRNHLHSGRENVPLVSVVVEMNEFQEALDGLREYTAPRTVEVMVDTEVRAAPWAEFTKSVQSGVTVLLPADTSRLELCSDSEHHVVTVDVQPWSEENLISFAKQLTWQLQAMALQGSVPKDEVKARAKAALEIVACADDEVRSVDTAKERKLAGPADSVAVKKSVFDRIMRKKVTTSRFLLRALRKELRELVDGSPLDLLTDEQLKQRLAIGTMVGKFHDRAMSFKALSVEDFMGRVCEFVALLKEPEKIAAVAALADAEEEAGLRSAFSLESNADVWAQDQLVDALEKMTSQYALVECLPLVGLAVNVLRTSASMINPWAARITHMSMMTPVLDSLSILTLDDGAAVTSGAGLQASLNLGEGEKEVVNAICSVVCSKQHAEAAGPFLTSRLYQVLHTHSTCGNCDTSDVASHPALLAAVICFLLDQK